VIIAKFVYFKFPSFVLNCSGIFCLRRLLDAVDHIRQRLFTLKQYYTSCGIK